MPKVRFDAPWIVAYQDGGHRLLRDGCVVVDGDRVTYVGRDYDGPADATRAVDRVITPGLISTHAHIHESPVDKSLGEDAVKRQFWSTSLIEVLPTKGAGMRPRHMRACVDYSLAEHIRTGTTTVMQMGDESDYVAEAAEKAGIRAYIAEQYRSGRWFTSDGRRVEYEWDEAGGERGLERAISLVEGLRGRANDRIRGFLNPAQADTCTESLLRDSSAAAGDLDVPIALHVSQSVSEFLEMTRRYGRTPVEWLADIGFLSDRCILGHVVFVSGNSWVNFAGDDLTLLADSGASVAYNAWVFARNGYLMETYRRYLDRGVNVCLGTDTVTQSMIESLRWTAVLGKIAERRSDGAMAQDVFDSATLRAAEMLKRPDLGRISPGAKADLLFWRIDSMFMTPMRDPIKNIVYYAQAEDLAEVMVDGQWLMIDGELQTIDVASTLDGVREAARHVWQEWPRHDWGHREVGEHLPLAYPEFGCGR